MRLGVILSTSAHALLLAWSVVGLSAPEPLRVDDEAEPVFVDIVPPGESTRSKLGEQTAAWTETPAPTPTQAPNVSPDAENVGDADNDVRSNREAETDNPPVDSAKETALPEAPKPIEAPTNEPEKVPAEENVPALTNELTSENEPAVPITEETQAETPPDPAESEQFAALDSVAAVPTRRPDPPKPQTAETTERQSSQKPATTANAAKPDQDKQLTDEIASLLNKQDPGVSGARRSSESASLGATRASEEAELSISEMDALKSQLSRCWSIPAGASGADGLTASVEFELDESARLTGRPRVTQSSGNKAFDDSAVRAVQICNQAGLQLPTGKYDIWREVQVNFDPRDMF